MRCVLFYSIGLLLVLLVLFLSCCFSSLLSLVAGVLFYAANESFSPRFCSASFFSSTWMEYICLYLCLIFPEMSNTLQHNNEVATCDVFLFFQGHFFTYLCRRLPWSKTIKIYCTLTGSWMHAWCIAVMSQMMGLSVLCTFNYLHSSVPLYWRNNWGRQWRHFFSKMEKSCSEWVAKRFSYTPF